MILRNDDALRGIDDFVAEVALARRALDDRGYLLIVTCACRRPSGHDEGCEVRAQHRAPPSPDVSGPMCPWCARELAKAA